jgi:mediator of RNA polymerase II transcription subunit 6
LNEANVLDYFSLSPFYEKSSINQNCIVQKIDFNTKKTQFIGLEFNLESFNKEKELFIITKKFRKNYNTTILISTYYVFKGTIYQSPDAYSIITSNIESISHSLVSVINELNN